MAKLKGTPVTVGKDFEGTPVAVGDEIFYTAGDLGRRETKRGTVEQITENVANYGDGTSEVYYKFWVPDPYGYRPSVLEQRVVAKATVKGK